MDSLPISPLRVPLATADLQQMLALLRLSWKLLGTPAYRQLIAAELPVAARFDPGHAGVMMGYDFHLTADGPRLIEINTNAGGTALALRACRGDLTLTPSLQRRLQMMFECEWFGYSGGQKPLKQLVILDEKPQQQALYPEMQQFVVWFEAFGIEVQIADPGELEADEDGVRFAGRPVDLIYNRHCDFYLEEPAMAGIRSAYLKGRVCLTPNPFVYGHLADKRRMILWRKSEEMNALGLSERDVQLLQRLIPPGCLLEDLAPDQAWSQRKKQVFKPVARFGSKGVLLGKSMSRKRFAELDPARTLVQELVPPSQVADDTGNSFKVDLRLYAWQGR